jgi:hypothetical protein
MDDSHAAVAQLIEGLDPGAMVTQFVVIAEVIGGDGQRAIWIDAHDGATPWDVAGLLAYAMTQEYVEPSHEDDVL